MARLSLKDYDRIRMCLGALYRLPGRQGFYAEISHILETLIPCERVSFSEINIDSCNPMVRTTPIPDYWPKLQSVFRAYMTQHPWLRPQSSELVNRPLTFDDFSRRFNWDKSELLNDYYYRCGATRQLSALLYQQDSFRVCVAFNRGAGSFASSSALLLELFCPHLLQIWKNTGELDSLHEKAHFLDGENDISDVHGLVLRTDGVIKQIAPATEKKLRQCFPGTRSGAGGVLPGEMCPWFLARVRESGASALGFCGAPVHRTFSFNESFIIARCLPLPDGTYFMELRFKQTEPTKTPGGVLAQASRLTNRESEILNWIAQGKRNGEIAIILESSERTVEKHVEHILEKLCVETRTAAALYALEQKQHYNGG